MQPAIVSHAILTHCLKIPGKNKKALVTHLRKKKHFVSSKATKAKLDALTEKIKIAQRNGKDTVELKQQRLFALIAAISLTQLHAFM